ncbi:hypothetical protein C2E23DRAFT_950871, partial [Lenzites betulinus]
YLEALGVSSIEKLPDRKGNIEDPQIYAGCVGLFLEGLLQQLFEELKAGPDTHFPYHLPTPHSSISPQSDARPHPPVRDRTRERRRSHADVRGRAGRGLLRTSGPTVSAVRRESSYRQRRRPVRCRDDPNPGRVRPVRVFLEPRHSQPVLVRDLRPGHRGRERRHSKGLRTSIHAHPDSCPRRGRRGSPVDQGSSPVAGSLEGRGGTRSTPARQGPRLVPGTAEETRRFRPSSSVFEGHVLLGGVA